MALVEVDRAAQAHHAVGAVGALDHERDRGGLHLGDHVVVGAIELRDVLRLVRHAGAVEEGVARHVGAGADEGRAARRGIGIAQPVAARRFGILERRVGRELHGPADEVGVELEAAVRLVALARHEGGLAGLVLLGRPAVAEVVVDQPGGPADLADGAARGRRAGHARDHVVGLREIELRVQQDRLHRGRGIDLAHAEHRAADAVGIAVDGLQRAGHGHRLRALPVALVPVLELARAVAAVLADLEHGGDEHLHLHGQFGAGLGAGRGRHGGGAGGTGQQCGGGQRREAGETQGGGRRHGGTPWIRG